MTLPYARPNVALEGNILSPEVSGLAPNVYFPIEIVSREYAGHMMLAARLASKGMNVAIGHKVPVKSFNAATNRPGVIFYKFAPLVEGHPPTHDPRQQRAEAIQLGNGQSDGRTPAPGRRSTQSSK